MSNLNEEQTSDVNKDMKLVKWVAFAALLVALTALTLAIINHVDIGFLY